MIDVLFGALEDSTAILLPPGGINSHCQGLLGQLQLEVITVTIVVDISSALDGVVGPCALFGMLATLIFGSIGIVLIQRNIV